MKPPRFQLPSSRDGSIVLLSTVGGLLAVLAGLGVTLASGPFLATAVGVGALAATVSLFAAGSMLWQSRAEHALSVEPRHSGELMALPREFSTELARALVYGKDTRTRADALAALAGSTQSPTESLIGALQDEEAIVRRGGLAGLAVLGDARAAQAMAKTLSDKDIEVRIDAILALAMLGSPSSTEAIAWTLHDPSQSVRRAAARGLERLNAMLNRRKQRGSEFAEARLRLASAWSELDERHRSRLAGARGQRPSDCTSLLSDSVAFSSVPVAEIEELATELGLEIDAVRSFAGADTGLGGHQLEALQRAATEYGWDAMTVHDAAFAASKIVSAGSPQRENLATIQDWLLLRARLLSESHDWR